MARCHLKAINLCTWGGIANDHQSSAPSTYILYYVQWKMHFPLQCAARSPLDWAALCVTTPPLLPGHLWLHSVWSSSFELSPFAGWPASTAVIERYKGPTQKKSSLIRRDNGTNIKHNKNIIALVQQRLHLATMRGASAGGIFEKQVNDLSNTSPLRGWGGDPFDPLSNPTDEVDCYWVHP